MADADDVPADGLYHGPDLDAAMAAEPCGPDHMGVCLTALASRREALVETQLDELSKMTDLGAQEGDDELTDKVIELRKLVAAQLGREPTANEVTALAFRIIMGGTFSRGMEIGLNLARQRQAKQPSWEVEHYPSGDALLHTSPVEAGAGEYVLVEQGKL